MGFGVEGLDMVRWPAPPPGDPPPPFLLCRAAQGLNLLGARRSRVGSIGVCAARVENAAFRVVR